jgi:hypothetical protein
MVFRGLRRLTINVSPGFIMKDIYNELCKDELQNQMQFGPHSRG